MSEPGTGRDLQAEIEAALADPSLQRAVPHATRVSAQARRRALEGFERYDRARRRAREIKEDAIERLPELVETLEASVRATGGQVHRAVDAEAACRIVADIARHEGCSRAVKSKSMTSEEVGLNAALEAAGVAVRETDLGEYVVQLAGDRPSHIIAPILHMGLEEVRDAFRRGLGLDDVPERPEELTQLARRTLREEFLAADLGITGANFLIAETGTVVIVENEGNARLCTQVPRVHVALVGIEKVIESLADLEPFLDLLPRSATGQLATSYLTLLSGPGWSGSPLARGPRRFHLVLLDNGRAAMRDDPVLREALYCIRCGACLNVCPPYQAVGGHVYGGPTYQSGIGNAWEAGVRGLEVAAEFNRLCTTCSRCLDVCPVSIDIPWMNSALRGRIRERDGGLVTSLTEEPVRLYRLARSAGPLRALAGTPPVRALLERRLGIDRRRALPDLPRQTLTEWFAARGDRLRRDGRDATVLLWADCHTEHVDVAVGQAAVHVLEALGHRVEIATGPCCGRAPLSQGNLPEARRQGSALCDLLERAVEGGTPILSLEPSCGTCVSSEYRRLLPDRVSGAPGRVTDLLVYLAERLDELEALLREAGPEGAVDPEDVPRPGRVVLHGHCQQKTAGWLPAAERLLRAMPSRSDVVTTSAECCGMAGSFGYTTGGYAIACELGARLEAEVDALAGGPAEVSACGTSCRAQLRALGRQDVRHPIELLAELLRER